MEFGCSGFSWETTDGLHLLGRTYDQAGDLKNNRIAIVPRGYPLPIEAGDGGGSVAGRYAHVGMAVMDFGAPILVDGVNEAGLMGALLNFPGYAAYPRLSRRSPVYPGFFLMLLLGRCASVQEAADAAERLYLWDSQIQGKKLQVHYMLTDRGGETAVLEPGPDGLAVHRNTIGVLTNSPDYPWQMTNLRNYVGVTNLPERPREMVNRELGGFTARFGTCSGLPGGYSSPERFVRLAFTKQFAVKATGERDAITQMFRAFAPVDTPKGMCSGPGRDLYMQTLCISAMCAETLTYYVSPAENRRISAVRLGPALDGKDARYLSLPDRQDIAYLN